MPELGQFSSRATGILVLGRKIGPERFLYTLPPWVPIPMEYEEVKFEEDGAIWNDIDAFSEEPQRGEAVTITNV